MSENFYQLPKYKNEKLYSSYRCPSCHKILRMKIFKENNLIKYNCSCKKEWYISYNTHNAIKKPKILDYHFKLRCSHCKILPNKVYKYLLKCLKCEKVICSKNQCKEMHSHQMKGDLSHLKNLNILDVICNIHSKGFIAYCITCDKDLCEACISEEKMENYNHNLIYYKDILPKKDVFIQNYEIFNKSCEVVASSFKGVRRKTNYRMIYLFHFREIVRNIYFNLSRFSKYNKFNFALISNVLENSDFKLLENKKQDIDLFLDFKYCPTSFFNSSNYIFDFLNTKSQPQTFFLENIYNIISYCFVSFPTNKYLIIVTRNKMQLYISKTFEMIYTKVTNMDIEISKYDFEDDRFIFSPEGKPNTIIILNINSAKKKVTFNKFNLITKNPYIDIKLVENSFLLQHVPNIDIYEYKDKLTIYDSITISSYNRKNSKYPLAVGLKDMIIYENSDNIFFYYMKTKAKVFIRKIENIKAIQKINKELVTVFCYTNNYNNYTYYLINVPKAIIMNIYSFSSLKIIDEIPILDKYIVTTINRERELQNIFTSKKINSLYFYGNNLQKINDKIKLLNHGLLSLSQNYLVFLYYSYK